MASFRSTITEQGIEHLTKLFVTGQALLLTRAEIGDGRMTEAQNQASAPMHPLTADVQIGEKSFIESTPSYLLLPIYVSNRDLRTAIYIREVMLYGQEEDGAEFPFAYAWLDGEDTDNILPATEAADGALDTVHIHEIALLMTDQMQAAIRIEVSGGNWVTAAQMEAYALKKPKQAGKAGQFLQLGESGTQWTDLRLPESFDNLLAYPGCTRTLEKEGSTYTEQIKTQGGTLRAKRVTVANGAESYTETYTFYAEDGETAAAQFTVQTAKDENGAWREAVTEG